MRTWPPGVSWYSSESAQLIASVRTAAPSPPSSRPAAARGRARPWPPCRRGCARGPPTRSRGRKCRRGRAAPAHRPARPWPDDRARAPLAPPWRPAFRAPAPPRRPRRREPPPTHRGAPPRRRGARSRSRGRAGGHPARRRAGRSRRSTSGRLVGDRSRCRGAREGQALEDGPVARGRPRRRDLPREAADDPFAAGRAEAGPQVGVVEQAGDGARRARRDRRARPASLSPRPRPRPRAEPRRSWPPVRRHMTSPRRLGVRSPRRARAPRRPRLRRRAGPAPRH